MFPITVVIRMHDAAGGCEPDHHQILHFFYLEHGTDKC